MANNPELLKMPLARDGQKSTIPETTDGSTGLFSQQYGWQSINSLPPQAGGKAVKREDFNGAFNLLGGIAFMAQKGFTFKWNADQDYYAGCVVIDDTDGLRYECIADVTANNTTPSADTTHWQIFKAGTDIDAWFRQASTVYAVGDMRCYESLPYGWYLDCTTAGTTGSSDITIPSPLNVGDTITDGTVVWTIRKISGGDGVPLGAIIAYSANGDLPSGYLLCDGSAVSRTMFPDLFACIGTTYGAGDGSTTFNVPDYNTAERFCQGSTVAGVVKQAGLPNITGGATGYEFTGTSNPVTNPERFSDNGKSVYFDNLTNAGIPTSGKTLTTNKDTSTGNSAALCIDASRSSAIYGNSDTVQPPALTCRYIIKAFDGMTPDSALIDITQYAQELATKANRQLSNLDTANLSCHLVVDSYYDATTGDWWREYDDGWIEQGGIVTSSRGDSSDVSNIPITLLKPMNDTNYYFDYLVLTSWQITYIVSTTKTTTTVSIRIMGGYNANSTWIAAGQGASA